MGKCHKEEKPLPWEENTFYYIKILHENISLWFGAQASNRVCDAQLDGTFQGRRCSLEDRREEQVKHLLESKWKEKG